MAAPLDLVERHAGFVTILQAGGRLMLDDGGDRILQDRVAALVAAGRLYFLLDLSRVTHIDSGGIGALASMHHHIVRRGGQFKLLSPSPRVYRVLRTTQLLKAFDVQDDEAAAIASFVPAVSRAGV